MKNLIALCFVIGLINLSCLRPPTLDANLAIRNANSDQNGSETVSIPSDALSFYVSGDGVFLQNNGNKELIGSLKDKKQLQKTFTDLLRDKENKAVFLKAPRSLRYADVNELVEFLKSAGAKPIGLQVDNLER